MLPSILDQMQCEIEEIRIRRRFLYGELSKPDQGDPKMVPKMVPKAKMVRKWSQNCPNQNIGKPHPVRFATCWLITLCPDSFKATSCLRLAVNCLWILAGEPDTP